MGNKPNAYLQKQEEWRIEYAKRRVITERQLIWDCIAVTLHKEFGWGYVRIQRFMDAMKKNYEEYGEAISSSPEADLHMEHLDRVLAEICNGHQELIPFDHRYPYLKRPTYEKRR